VCDTKNELRKMRRYTKGAKAASEIQKEWYRRIERSRSGGRVAWVMAGVPTELLFAFNIATAYPENYGPVCAARAMATPFMEIAEADGFSEDLCSYIRVALGYASAYNRLGAIPPGSPMGGMQKPDMLITLNLLCDTRIKCFQTLGTRYFNVPLYVLDIQSPPYGTDFGNHRIKEQYVGHAKRELWKLIRFLEENTKQQLDIDKLRENLVNSLRTQRLIYQIHKLRRAVPCPMPSGDSLHCVTIQLNMSGTREALEFYQALYDEVNQRVANKVGVIAEERHRLLFLGIPPWFNMGFFNYLESLGAVSVMEHIYFVGDPLDEDLDTSDPVTALAEYCWLRALRLHQHGGELCQKAVTPGPVPGSYPAGEILKFLQDYKIDGVIMHSTRSCRVVSLGQAHYRNLLHKIGMPVLALESDMTDPRTWSDMDVKRRVELFLSMLESS